MANRQSAENSPSADLDGSLRDQDKLAGFTTAYFFLIGPLWGALGYWMIHNPETSPQMIAEIIRPYAQPFFSLLALAK